MVAASLQRLDVNGLSYAYSDTGRGISDIHFSLKRGSFTVITGTIGSGKTTLVRSLLGLLPKGEGTIAWNGVPVEDPGTFFTPPRSAYTAQVPRLYSDTLRNNILLGQAEQGDSLQHGLTRGGDGVRRRAAAWRAGHRHRPARGEALRRASAADGCSAHARARRRAVRLRRPVERARRRDGTEAVGADVPASKRRDMSGRIPPQNGAHTGGPHHCDEGRPH